MIKLDLHGVCYDDVKKKLEHHLNLFWNSNQELKIITGHSTKMKKIVLDILEQYRLLYTIGDFSGNTGYIRTILD